MKKSNSQSKTVLGVIPEGWEKRSHTQKELEKWKIFRKKYTIGSKFLGRVVSVDHYGCYIDIQEPVIALLLVPYIKKKEKGGMIFPNDYPYLGEDLNVKIKYFSDDLTDVIGKVTLEQCSL